MDPLLIFFIPLGVGLVFGFIGGYQIGWIKRVKEEPVEFIHDPVRWNDASAKMCGCGRLWPHD